MLHYWLRAELKPAVCVMSPCLLLFVVVVPLRFQIEHPYFIKLLVYPLVNLLDEYF